jgi:hypothetical protein
MSPTPAIFALYGVVLETTKESAADAGVNPESARTEASAIMTFFLMNQL